MCSSSAKSFWSDDPRGGGGGVGSREEKVTSFLLRLRYFLTAADGCCSQGSSAGSVSLVGDLVPGSL